ncbi:MAG TPA: hypothetical protein DCE42_07335 [Myxococcales bacterium]|nr:hypothetical protein [Myxococcales bacterium]
MVWYRSSLGKHTRKAVILLSMCLFFIWHLPAHAWFPLLTKGRCKSVGTPCRATIGNSGGGGACCDPSTLTQDCITNNYCEGAHIQRWSKLPVTWKLNTNGMAGKSGYTSLTEKDIEKAMIAGWDAWKQPCSTFSHKYLGTTTAPPSYFDNSITIYLPSEAEWDQLGATGALAFSSPKTDEKGQFVDGDLFYNPRYSWGIQGKLKEKFDLQGVNTHESGHSIGFAHSHLQSAIMYYRARPAGEAMKLGTDDIQGICVMYPKRTGACTTDKECGTCYQCSQFLCTANAPKTQTLCGTCNPAAPNCQGNEACVQTDDTFRCLPTCQGTDNCCPEDFRCVTHNNKKMCVPIAGSCTTTTCTQDKDCASGTTCIDKVCRAKNISHDKACNTTCKTHAECGNNNKCFSIGPDEKRCLQPCTSDFFCPTGYQCRPTTEGRLCIPADEFFCPCSENTDCPSGKICRNRLCQNAQGGGNFDNCNENVPCQKGYTCLRSSNGGTCILPCDPNNATSCPTGTTCRQYGSYIYVCRLAPSQNAYETCNTKDQCKDGLVCIPSFPGSWGGTCIPTCEKDPNCANGGMCTPVGNGQRVCQCNERTPQAPCKSGYTCQIWNEKTKGGVCICNDPSCRAVCGDGKCEANGGENCQSCAQDCKCPATQSCTNGACLSCGNGVCDPDENCALCAQDCACTAPKACVEGTCQLCGNGVCETQQGENCSTCAKDCSCNGDTCENGVCLTCGDGVCHPQNGENCQTCKSDCGCSQEEFCEVTGQCIVACGDGVCNPAHSENCETCAKDCACKANQQCTEGVCKDLRCGNGICELIAGENCFSCAADCACHTSQVCFQNACLDRRYLCPQGFVRRCDADGKNCREECVPGCGCQSTTPPSSTPLFLLLFFILLARRSRRYD